MNRRDPAARAAVPVPLVETRPGMYMAQVDGRAIASTADFVVIVRSDLPEATLRRAVPAFLMIGPIQADLPRAEQATKCIPLRPLPIPPRHLSVGPDAICFQLDRDSPHWPPMGTLGGFVIYMAGNLPNTRLELWSVDRALDGPEGQADIAARSISRDSAPPRT